MDKTKAFLDELRRLNRENIKLELELHDTKAMLIGISKRVALASSLSLNFEQPTVEDAQKFEEGGCGLSKTLKSLDSMELFELRVLMQTTDSSLDNESYQLNRVQERIQSLNELKTNIGLEIRKKELEK